MNPKEQTLAELIADLNKHDPNQVLPPNNPTFSVNTIDTINLTGASTDTVTVGPASDTITLNLSDYNYSFPGGNVHGPYAYGMGGAGTGINDNGGSPVTAWNSTHASEYRSDRPSSTSAWHCSGLM